MAKKITLEQKTYKNSKGETCRTKVWYLHHRGRRISTGKDTRQKALKWARVFLATNGDQQRHSRRQQKLQKAALELHLDRWQQELSRGGFSDWDQTKVSRIRKLLDWCGFSRLPHLNARKLGRVLDEKIANKELALKTVNGYVIEAKAFGDFLVADGVLKKNPIREIGRNGKSVLRAKKPRAADRTKRRRYLRQEELQHLLHTVESENRTVQGVSAADRSIAYRLAASSGLRKGEIASLRRGWFALDDKPSIVYLSPDHSKNAQGAFQPLPDRAVSKLRAWIADKQDGRVLPLEKKRTSEMLAEDLTAAKIPVIDERGLVVDFHALRYTYCALLALNDVPIAVVSQLMRHSSLDLTAKLYLSLGLRDLLDEVNKIPEF